MVGEILMDTHRPLGAPPSYRLKPLPAVCSGGWCSGHRVSITSGTFPLFPRCKDPPLWNKVFPAYHRRNHPLTRRRGRGGCSSLRLLRWLVEKATARGSQLAPSPKYTTAREDIRTSYVSSTLLGFSFSIQASWGGEGGEQIL